MAAFFGRVRKTEMILRNVDILSGKEAAVMRNSETSSVQYTQAFKACCRICL